MNAELQIEATEIAEIAVSESRELARENYREQIRKHNLSGIALREFTAFIDAEIRRIQSDS